MLFLEKGHTFFASVKAIDHLEVRYNRSVSSNAPTRRYMKNL